MSKIPYRDELTGPLESMPDFQRVPDWIKTAAEEFVKLAESWCTKRFDDASRFPDVLHTEAPMELVGWND